MLALFYNDACTVQVVSIYSLVSVGHCTYNCIRQSLSGTGNGPFMFHESEQHTAVVRPRIRKPVADTLDEIMDEHEYNTYDEAITHALREAGYEL